MIINPTAKTLADHLNSRFVERQEIVNGMLVALAARQHMLIIGPPGTAKSNMITELACCIAGGSYFQWLLSQFSTPEELFGPISLKALEQGSYQRNTAGKLPEAHIAFVDEIFKANSAILNSLLTLINERLFYNNGSPVQVPLMTMFGASNEYPDEDENLGALYDRFLLRFEVKPISEEAAFKTMLAAEKEPSRRPVFSLEEIKNLQEQAEKVSVGPEIFDILVEIRTKLADENIRPSDRRFRQGLDVLKASAALRDDSYVQPQDLNILASVFWEEPKQKPTVAALIREYTVDKLSQELERIMAEATEIGANATSSKTTELGIEANKKLKALTSELDELKKKNPSKAHEIDGRIQKVTEINKQVLVECLGLAYAAGN